MTVNLCVVSGTLVAPDGSLMPEVQVQFLPAPVTVRARGTDTIAPRPVQAVSDAGAGLSVGLAPGVYTLRTREADGREYPPVLVDVPMRETVELAEILVHLPAPQSVYDAAASARAAANAAGVADAIAAELAREPSFPSRAAFAAASLPAPVQRWTVLHAGLVLQYLRDPEGTAIESANGVKGSPAETARPEHWGAMRDGVTNDGPAINAALSWRGHCVLTGGGPYLTDEMIRLDGATLEGGNPDWPRNTHACIRGSAQMPLTAPVIGLVSRFMLRGVRVEYATDALAGTPVDGQRVGIAGLENAPHPQKAAVVQSVRISDVWTGVRRPGFSVSYDAIEIVRFRHCGWDNSFVTSTGNNIGTVYLKPSHDFTPAYGVRMTGGLNGFWAQLNIEHGIFSEAAIAIDDSANLHIGTLHLEGLDVPAAGAAWCRIGAAQVSIANFAAIHCGMSHDYTAIFELADAETKLLPYRSARSSLVIGNLQLRGVADPDAGLYPGYPAPRRGVQNIAGFKLFRRQSGFSDRNFRVEVGHYLHGSYAAAGAPERDLLALVDTQRYSDVDRLDLMRFGRVTPVRGENLLHNGGFRDWISDSATSAGGTVFAECAHGWNVVGATGAITGQRIVAPLGDPDGDHLEVTNAGAAGTFQRLYHRISDYRRLLGNAPLTLSFEARATVGGRRLEQIAMLWRNIGGNPANAFRQIVAGGDPRLDMGTGWQAYRFTFTGPNVSLLSALGGDPHIALIFEINGGSADRESTFALRRVKLEPGGSATGFTLHPQDACPVVFSIARPPARIGQVAVVGGEAHVAVGTAHVSDWKRIT